MYGLFQIPDERIHEVSFHGTQVLVIEKSGAYFVPMKPLCGAMGIDWESQRQLIQRDPVLRSVACMIQATARDGKKYESACLPIEYLNGWLFKLDVTRYPEEMQDKLICYQKECYKVLFSHFFSPPPQRHDREFKDEAMSVMRFIGWNVK